MTEAGRTGRVAPVRSHRASNRAVRTHARTLAPSRRSLRGLRNASTRLTDDSANVCGHSNCDIQGPCPRVGGIGGPVLTDSVRISVGNLSVGNLREYTMHVTYIVDPGAGESR